MQTVSTCPEDNGSSFPDRSLGSKPKKKKLLDRLKEKFLTRLIFLLYCLITQCLTTSHWHIFPKTIWTPVILMKAMTGNFLPYWETWCSVGGYGSTSTWHANRTWFCPKLEPCPIYVQGDTKKSSIWKARTSLEILLVINWTLFLTKCSLCMIFPPSFKSLSATLSFLCTFQDML